MTLKDLPEIDFHQLMAHNVRQTPLRCITMQDGSDFYVCYEAVKRSFEKLNPNTEYEVYKHNMQLIAIQL